MTEFTPLSALAGGALIGCSAVLLMALDGRIAGISGILGGLLPPRPAADWDWRLSFLAGAAAAPLLWRLALGAPPGFVVSAAVPMLVVGGFLVGIGATFASGCPSGHGICGLSRLSRRSFAAVATFMATAAATVFIVRHVIGA